MIVWVMRIFLYNLFKKEFYCVPVLHFKIIILYIIIININSIIYQNPFLKSPIWFIHIFFYIFLPSKSTIDQLFSLGKNLSSQFFCYWLISNKWDIVINNENAKCTHWKFFFMLNFNPTWSLVTINKW